MYVYVSNETPNIDVFFDNLQVSHIRGPILDETHYYPFGLTMHGISNQAASFGKTNDYKFNGGDELENAFNVNTYSTFFRTYDQQLGRFTGIDILAESFSFINPYQFGYNNPITYNDPLGAMNSASNGRMQKDPNGNYHAPWLTKLLWGNEGFYGAEEMGMEGGGGGNGGSGVYYNMMGLSSTWVLSQMNFGDKFGRNKDGEYGFWSKYAYSIINGSGSTLNELVVGMIFTELNKQKWPSFNTIWNNYGRNMSDPNQQCPTNEKWYHGGNCCAIRVSAALKKSGVDFRNYYPKYGNITKDGLARGANDLRNWLIENMPGEPEIMTAEEFSAKYFNNKNAQGVIWFDYPVGTDGQDVNHIDLFNGAGKKVKFGSRPTRQGTSNVLQIYFWCID